MNIFGLFGFKKKWLVILFFALLLRSIFIDFYELPTATMEPNYNNGMVVFANKISYNLILPFSNKTLFKTGQPRRGDVVVYFSEESNAPLISRVVGLPKDQVTVLEDGWYIVNNQELTKKFIASDASDMEGLDAQVFFRNLEGSVGYKVKKHFEKNGNAFQRYFPNRTFVLEENQYFVASDNIDLSHDSRNKGPIEHKNLLGKIITDPEP